MKTIHQLKKNNDEIMARFPKSLSDVDEKLRNKANRAISLNNKCILAIEQGMTHKKAEKSLDEVKAKLKVLSDNYETWKNNTPDLEKYKNLLGHYNSLNSVP